jgi:thiol:disulfide interchange protein
MGENKEQQVEQKKDEKKETSKPASTPNPEPPAKGSNILSLMLLVVLVVVAMFFVGSLMEKQGMIPPIISRTAQKLANLFEIDTGASADEEVHNDSVKKLVSSEFDDFIEQNDFVLVMFYAPWCGHCKHLAPIYSQVDQWFASQTNRNIKLAKVDATEE